MDRRDVTGASRAPTAAAAVRTSASTIDDDWHLTVGMREPGASLPTR